MDFNSPGREWGGADPRAYESADGTWFMGALEKNAAGILRLVIYHTDAHGALIGLPWEPGILGQGGLVLQGNGRLDAQGYATVGDNATRRSVPVPGWKAWTHTHEARVTLG